MALSTHPHRGHLQGDTTGISCADCESSVLASVSGWGVGREKKEEKEDEENDEERGGLRQ